MATQKANGKKYLNRIAGFGCIVCGRDANIHHIRDGQGIAQRSSDYLAIPLCRDHHQGEDSIHGDPAGFAAQHGTELDLLAETIRRVFMSGAEVELY